MSGAPRRWMARFETERELVHAIPVLARAGAEEVDAATPCESEEVLAVLGVKRSRIPTAAFGVAVLAGFGGWWIEWWTRNVSFPSEVGARPNVSSWADLPIVFETTVLAVAVSSFVALFVKLGLPRLRHPWFAVDRFGSDDASWLAWREPDDGTFDQSAVASTLVAMGATDVVRVVDQDAGEGGA